MFDRKENAWKFRTGGFGHILDRYIYIRYIYIYIYISACIVSPRFFEEMNPISMRKDVFVWPFLVGKKTKHGSCRLIFGWFETYPSEKEKDFQKSLGWWFTFYPFTLGRVFFQCFINGLVKNHQLDLPNHLQKALHSCFSGPKKNAT